MDVKVSTIGQPTEIPGTELLMKGDCSVLATASLQVGRWIQTGTSRHPSASEALHPESRRRLIQGILDCLSAALDDVPQDIYQRLSKIRTNAVAIKRI